MTSLASGFCLAVDEGEAYDFLSTLCIVKASGTATNNALGVVETRLPAGFSPPPHIHHDEDEAFYLLSGRIEAQLGDQKIPAEQGAFLWLPRNVLHGFVVSADGPCTILTITTPAGFDRFVAEVGTPPRPRCRNRVSRTSLDSSRSPRDTGSSTRLRRTSPRLADHPRSRSGGRWSGGQNARAGGHVAPPELA